MFRKYESSTREKRYSDSGQDELINILNWLTELIVKIESFGGSGKSVVLFDLNCQNSKI